VTAGAQQHPYDDAFWKARSIVDYESPLASHPETSATV
jgi:hypothetical protein